MRAYLNTSSIPLYIDDEEYVFLLNFQEYQKLGNALHMGVSLCLA